MQKLYFIGGKARTGKDTLGKALKKYYEEQGKRVCILKITAPLNDLLRNYFHWDGKDDTKPRDLMQKIGYDIIHEKLGQEYFLLNHLMVTIDVLSSYYDVGIITDGRLKKEMDVLKEKYKDIKTIHLIREEQDSGLTEEEKKHKTETDLDDSSSFSYVIQNNKGIRELEEIAKNIVEKEVI